MRDLSLLTWKEIKKIIDGEVDEKTIISGRIKETDNLLKDMKKNVYI